MSNDLITAIHISHEVDLQAYSNEVVRRIRRILDLADKDLFAELISKLSDLDATQFSVQRLYALLASVRKLNGEVYDQVYRQLQLDLGDLAVNEVEFSRQLIEVTSKLKPSVISKEQAFAAGNAKPMRGKLMQGWARSMAVRRMERIQDYLAMSYVEGKTIDQMVRGLRGTRSGGYRDGLIALDRREAEAVVRTAISHHAQEARQLVYDKNADIIKTVRWTSTLDSRTTPLCRVRDGLVYTAGGEHRPVGHRVPWLGGPGALHWNCRSVSVPIIDLGLEGPSERASMDGPVSAKLTYAEWLKRQPAARQDEILGPTRGRLMRKGKYTMDRFHNNEGRFLRIEELRAKDAETFARLGM